MTLALNDKLTTWKTECGSREDDFILDTLYMKFRWDHCRHICTEIRWKQRLRVQVRSLGMCDGKWRSCIHGNQQYMGSRRSIRNKRVHLGRQIRISREWRKKWEHNLSVHDFFLVKMKISQGVNNQGHMWRTNNLWFHRESLINNT